MSERNQSHDVGPYSGINHSPTGNITLIPEEQFAPLEDKALLNLAGFFPDRDDLTLLIDMLGLDPAVGRRKSA